MGQIVTFDAEKQEVELSLARTVLTQLDNGGISYEQSQEISRAILAYMEKVINNQELLAVLQVLAQKWAFFESIYSLYKLKVVETVETASQLHDTEEKLHAIQTDKI